MAPGSQKEDRPDGSGGRSYRSLVRWLALAVGALGLKEAGLGVVFGEPRAVVLGLAAIGYAVLITHLSRRFGDDRRTAAISQVAMATLAIEALAAALQPSVATAMAIASLLPAVMVVPILPSRDVFRLLIAGGVVGSFAAVAGMVVPPTSRIPAELQTLFGLVTLLVAFLFLIVFLWEVSHRLKSSASELRSVVTMSADLSMTLDPRLVGNLTALHIAQASGADDCALSYWDRATDRVVTLGYYPAQRRNALNETYALAEYPATRRVLDSLATVRIDTTDAAADRAEVAYLESIGQRSMVMIPLVAAGQAVGVVELTSTRVHAFDDRQIELATMLAGEAAMALENARLYDQIRHQALHDGLSGLANRVLFRERVEHAVLRSHGRHGGPFAILFVDLDDFKVLNDTLGHAHGDAVLATAARRIVACVRPEDTAARLGGDEFAILLEGVGEEDAALAVATRLADALREPVDLGDRSPSIAASIGVVIGGGSTDTADELLRNADVAMYAAKRSVRGGATVFRPSMRELDIERSARAGLLRGVEQRGELRLDYQPIVDLETREVVALEALVRWQPPEGGPVMPDRFIELAEETGDIVPIGRWVLREACRQLRDWQVRLDLPALRISVNLSAREFREHDFISTVRTALEETGVDPTSLMLEITESGLMSRTEGSIGRLTALRSLGVHLAIDDFGTGYSSLSYLERFPIDILKIDRSFIAESDGSSAIARAVIDLGRTLGLQVVAEGIEDQRQADRLVELGCGFGQGYLFARPMQAAAAEAFLAEGTRPEAERTDVDDVAPVRSRARRRALRLVSGG